MKPLKMILVGTSFSIGLAIAFFGILQVASHKVIAALPEETVTCLPYQGIELAAANPQLYSPLLKNRLLISRLHQRYDEVIHFTRAGGLLV